LAIDYADQNYFASSALDQPSVLIWDRRATSRPSSAPSYLEAIDSEEIPWGAGLKIDRATNVSPEQFRNDKFSLIRSLRFCRDHRGLLAVLSRTGQLKVLETKKEFVGSEVAYENSPELLEVKRSTELDNGYADPNRKDDRIVSFDWVTLGSPVLAPRAVVLRASGAFDILEKPSYTSDHVYKMVPWQSPYRGLAGSVPTDCEWIALISSKRARLIIH
jgi:WD repeat-containing protein mio